MIRIYDIKVFVYTIDFRCEVRGENPRKFRMSIRRKDFELLKMSSPPSLYSRLAHGIVMRYILENGIDVIPKELYGEWG